MIIGYATRKAFISDKVQFLNINKPQTQDLPRNQVHLNANQSKPIITSMHDRIPHELETWTPKHPQLIISGPPPSNPE